MGRRPSSKDDLKDDLKATQRKAMYDAVKEFNRMIPTLNGFARSLTGNPKVRVKASARTETDGVNIYIRPPLALAVKLNHERAVCNQRNSEKRLICARCARDESVWHKMHHELAHILGKSMKPTTQYGVQPILDLIDEYHPAGACSHGSEIRLAVQGAPNYLGATGAHSQFLHYILQSLEDARIDAHMIQIKPGLRTQFYAAMWEVFTYGVEGDLGDEGFMWRDAPLNSQVIIGLSVIAGGYTLEPGWFLPEAHAVLDDPRVRKIASGAGLWHDVAESTERAVAMFRLLASIGLVKIDRCTPSKPNAEGEESGESGEPVQDDEAGTPDPGGDGEQDGDGSASGEEPDSDSGSPAPDDADAGEGQPGSGDDAGDPTGDGSAGDTAESGTFGDDFKSDARADGSSKQGGTADDQSDEAPVPAGDVDEDAGQDDSGRESDVDAGDDGDQDQTGPVDSTSREDEVEASDDSPEEGGSGGSGSRPSDECSSSDRDGDAEESDRDGEGQPPIQGEGDIGSGAGGSGDGPDPEGEALDGDSPPAEAGTEDASEGDPLGPESLDEEDGPEPVGSDIWDEANDPLRGIRGMTPGQLGLPDEVADFLNRANPHEHIDDAVDSDADTQVDGLDDEEIMQVLIQAMTDVVGQALVFDMASQEVGGISEYEFPCRTFRWVDEHRNRPELFIPPESIIGPALMKARAVFADNQRSKRSGNLTSGRVDGRKIARRAPFDDERMFYKKVLPGKRDYIVGITVDCSGSTETAGRMERIKRAVFAKAEILSRLGIKFYITGHTGGRDDYWIPGGWLVARSIDPNTLENLMLLWVKKVDEPWNDATRKRLSNLGPLASNFDGHTLEFHRKLLEQRRESDKVLIYYTDGDMPAANYTEELEILQREINTCKQKKISLLAVGINTMSPQDHGFDTVRVDSDEDINKVVAQLERRLTASR